MDMIKIGAFIAECRKEKQFTQQQLADKLNITNKAVSKWETGNGFPDITLLKELADILEVSVDEILNAKKNETASPYVEQLDKGSTTEKVAIHSSDVVLGYMVHKAIDKFKMMSIVSMILAMVGIIIQYFIWIETRDLTGWVFGCWLEICSVGIYYYYSTIMKSQMRDYNTTAENKLDAKDITDQSLRYLRIIWALIPVTLLFYLFQ